MNSNLFKRWKVNIQITCKSVPADSMGVRTPVSESKKDGKNDNILLSNRTLVKPDLITLTLFTCM